MLHRCIVVVIAIFFMVSNLSGQCPDRLVLWNRLIFLSNSTILPEKQLEELLPIAARIKDCPPNADSVYAYLIRRIGTNYFFQNDYLKAAQYYRESADVITLNAASPAIKTTELISAYYFLSLFYDLLGDIPEKIKASDSCIAWAMRLKRPSDISCVASLYNKVEYYFDLGDYRRCIDNAIMCEKYAWEYAAGEKDEININAGRTNAESSFLWRVKAHLMLKEYETAEKLLANKVAGYEKSKLKNYLGTLYSQLADVQIHKGNFENALQFLNKSLESDLSFHYNLACKQTTKDIGYEIFFKHLNNGNKALEYYRKAMKFVNKDETRKTADVFESLNIYTNIADVYVSKEMYDSAFFYFQRGFDQLRQGYTESDILNGSNASFIKHKKIHYLTGLFISKADAYRKQFEEKGQVASIQKAIRIYKLTDRLLDRIKVEQTELESKLFWRTDSRRLYENAIGACILQGSQDDAFYFFEKSRAVLLNDQLNEQQLLDKNELARISLMNKQIVQYRRQLEPGGLTDQKQAGVQEALFQTTQRLDQMKREMQVKHPLYFQSYLDTTLCTIADIQKQILSGNDAFVELFSGSQHVYLLVITKNGVKLTAIGKMQYEQLAAEYIRMLSDPEQQNLQYDQFVSISGNLYRLIFQNNPVPPGRVIIAPDGQYFPFESLITSAKGEALQYFLNDHAVSYAHSARFLLRSYHQGIQNASRNFLGIAPIQYPGSMKLAALNGSDHSLKTVKGYFDLSENFISGKASKANFLREFYKYRIIQLYTHASEKSDQNEPVIYFADSSLYLSDLIREDQPVTDLIVLSACETGKGRLYEGEGVFSLNRGFAAMGIPASVTNLWSVENESTYAITELFYKYVAKGMPVDIALQKAKLSFIQSATGEKKLPFYWAGAILVGKNDPVVVKKSYAWQALVVVLVFSGMVYWILKLVKRRKKSPANFENNFFQGTRKFEV